MVTKFINARVAALALSIAILILVFFILGLNAKTKLLLQQNKNLTTTLETLNVKILALSQKIQEVVSEVDRQRTELEETKNKLTQERLRNVELNGQVEELRAKISPTS